jgi:hypothetical protein
MGVISLENINKNRERMSLIAQICKSCHGNKEA